MNTWKKLMITLKIGTTTSSRANAKTMDDEQIKSSILESRWRLGIGVIDGRKLSIERRVSLGEYEYRLNGVVINDPECWIASEYMEWRDK